jgi:Protein of unknown function DUF262
MAIQSLERQTAASAMTVEDLLGMVQQGKVRVPDWQRKFKWRGAQVQLLFDSILHDYPIGTLLFWEHPALEARIKFGSWQLQTRAREDAWWVVDGQQRIHSLAGALLGDPNTRSSRDRFGLAYDLEARAVVPWRRNDSLPHQVPLPVLVDSEALLAWLLGGAQQGLGARLHPVAMAANRRLREYKIPAYIVADPNLETARQIFIRMNTTGLGMTATDVFRALQQEVDGVPSDPILDLGVQVEQTGFGELPPRALTAAVAMANRLDPIVRQGQQLAELDPGVALPRAERAIRRAIQFLIDDALLPRAELLPYQFVFSLLVRFFDHHPDPHPRTRQVLARVVWRGIVGDVLRGTSAAHVGRLTRACALPEADALDALIQATHIPAVAAPWGDWAPRSAATRLLATAMLDVAAPLLTAAGAAHTTVGGGWWSTATTCLLPTRSNEPATWLLHPPQPDPIAALVANPTVAAAHGFDSIALDALRDGRLELALSRRTTWLQGTLRRFLELRCALGLPDLLAMETLSATWEAV